jgi:hypothetical protein
VKEKLLRKFSLARAVFWLILLVPSFFLGWVYSVAFVSVCSLYANFASDFAAWRADENKEILGRLDRIEKMLEILTGEANQIDN